MDYFLIVVLAIVVIALWRRSRDATASLRSDVDDLLRTISDLRAQVAALTRAAASSVQAPSEPRPEQRTVAQPVPGWSPKPEQDASAAHAAPTQVAAFAAAPPPPPTSAGPTRDAAVTPPPPPPPTTDPEPSPWQGPPDRHPPHHPLPPPVPPPVPRRPDAVPAPPPPTTDPEPSPWQGPPDRHPPHHPLPPGPLTPQEPAPAGGFFSLEERLGSNWLSKIGIACVVIGIAFFLGHELETWGPAGKVLCGFAVSAALLLGGVWLERKPTYKIFARAGIGGGWALGFFVTFAMHHVDAARVLDSLVADLALMLLVAAGMVAHSLKYRSQAVTALAFLLGFFTLMTSNLEASAGTVVFTLAASAILAIALVVITTLRHWAWLELTGLIAVYVCHFVWLTQVLTENHASFTEFWPSTALILLYWAIFRLAYVLRTPLDAREENISSLSAVLNSTGVLGLLKYQSAHPEWAFWALAALGAVEMALAFWARPRRRQAFVVLSTIAAVLLVAAVPFRFHGVSWPVLWLVEAQVLALCGLRLGEPVFRRLGLIAGVLTGGVLAVHDVLPLILLRLDQPDPARHTSLIVALALAAVLYWVHAEVYTRRWPQIAAHELEALALRVTSWLALGAGATALWVALPDQWMPVGWLALVLALGFAARRFGALRLGYEADALGLAAGGVLAFHHVAPLALSRFDNADPSHHAAETAVLALAALAYWIHAEVYPRVLVRAAGVTPEFGAWAGFMQPAMSLLGTAAAASALWVVLPAPWVAPGWLALVLLMGAAADGLKAEILAVQCDLLAACALAGLFFWDLGTTGWWDHQAPVGAAIVLLYAGMRRHQEPAGSRNYVPAAYSWAATLILAYLAADASANVWIASIWAALGLGLFEAGRWFRKGFLRWQGFLLIALAFCRYFGFDLPVNGDFPVAAAGAVDRFSLTNSVLLEALVLAAVGYALLERTRNTGRCPPREHIIGLIADALGTVSIALWFAYRFPSAWVPAPSGEAWVTAIWAGMATVLLALAWLMRRRAFLVQAVALAVAAVLRGFFLDLSGGDLLVGGQAAGATPDFWHGALFRIGVACVILLAALPFAFRLRGPEFWEGASIHLPAEFEGALRRPEQWFFFAPFALAVGALAIKLSSGHITIAWSLVGVGVFLFALAVGERSYRLAGLALLLVCVVKIVLMDVWQLSPPERYTTLIVLGLALLAVSFLYTRFGKTIRKFL